MGWGGVFALPAAVRENEAGRQDRILAAGISLRKPTKKD